MAASMRVTAVRHLRRFRLRPSSISSAARTLTLEYPDHHGTSHGCSLCGSRLFSTSYWRWAKKMEKPFVPSRTKPKHPVVKVWKNITLAELAKVVERPIDDIYEAIVFVENAGQYDHDDCAIDDADILFLILKRLGLRGQLVAPPEQPSQKKEFQDAVRRPPADPSVLVPRPPVITIMGHVDHGKTTLLDTLRNTNVVDQEFGGITQHIGAFTVKLPGKDRITFLDTPGHAAFSAMRERGAMATDIVILVVAADDGVMEQTVESIRYAREANVPMIVAINKMDKPTADIDNVKKGLIVHGIQMDDEGGDTQYVCISALKGTNLDKLTETILTQAELMEIKADPKGPVEGVIIESMSDQHRGKLSTALVQRGTLRKGAYLVAGLAWAKVRGMFDEWGKPVQSAPPGTPVQVIGWRSLPSAGDVIIEVESEKRAQQVVHWRESQMQAEKDVEEYKAIQEKVQQHLKQYKVELEQRRAMGHRKRRKRLTNREKEYTVDSTPCLPIVVKADVDGSVEAVLDLLDTYHSHQKCRLDIIHYGVGPVSESDVELAQPFNGIVYAFHVPVLGAASSAAEEGNVDIRSYNVIYHLVDDIKKELGKRLPLLDEDEVHGEALVQQEFMINEGRKKIPVAGCKCTKGTLRKNALYKVVRDSETIHSGPLVSMRHLKNEVESIKKDVECGLMFQDPNVRFKHGDILVCYSIKQVPQETDWDPGF
ncbi:translation initiation factor IF-2, mitochondrial [Dermacentor silvarum]|uniref:translation initiation factor IF-2, mitochondrial n=1 Tax=Dermacentor silvarum TaxID=543639 RepID=UPI001899D1DF|nr:translation initiation factor IF-2, mitochondrial [Dermacentor silvarum]